MKLFSVFTILAAAIVTVCATHAETNAARFARGLPPLPPQRRSTPVDGLLYHASRIYCTDDFVIQLPGGANPLDPQEVRVTLAKSIAATPSPTQKTLPRLTSSMTWV